MNGTEFEQVTAFLAAVEHGGFTAAGLALGRDGSHPLASRHGA